jgi:transcriptional regulator of acetoin/glycerol metabolism
MEKAHIHEVLKECSWNVTQTAKILGINRVTLHKKIKRLKLERKSNNSANPIPHNDNF